MAQGLNSPDMETRNFREKLFQQSDKLSGTKAVSNMVGLGVDPPVDRLAYRQRACARSGQSLKEFDSENSTRGLRVVLSGAR